MKYSLLLVVTLSLSARAERELSLGEYSREARREMTARVAEALRGSGASGTVCGTVTYVGDEHYFIQTGHDGLKVFSATLPNVGETVAVTGSPALEGGRVVLRASGHRVEGHRALPAPVSADARSLVYVGTEASKDVNWSRVVVRGRAIGVTEIGFAMDVGGLPVNVRLNDPPRFIADCARTRPMVSVTGVAEMMLDQSVLFGHEPYVLGVKLSVLGPADVVLEPDAVYLLNLRDRRMTIMTVVIVSVLTLALLFAAGALIRQRRRHFRTVTLMSERKRMADDLHDTIEQNLVGAGMLIRLGKAKEAQDVLVRAKREIRDIVWGLKNDDMMRLTPAEMIRELARQETKKGICRVETRLEGLPQTMEAREMRDLSLIIREAIGNAVKHGQAKKVAISSDPRSGGGWLLRIGNDGKPFDASTALGPADGHFGLEGMRERGRRLHAEVTFGRKGDWTVVSVEVKK